MTARDQEGRNGRQPVMPPLKSMGPLGGLHQLPPHSVASVSLQVPPSLLSPLLLTWLPVLCGFGCGSHPLPLQHICILVPSFWGSSHSVHPSNSVQGLFLSLNLGSFHISRSTNTYLFFNTPPCVIFVTGTATRLSYSHLLYPE